MPASPRRVLASWSLLWLAAVGCSDTGSTTPVSGPPSTPPATTGAPTAADLAVELFADYPRYLWHERRLAIATTNVGNGDIEVTVVGLRADHFAVLEPELKSARIAPGSRIDLQVDFGEVIGCDPAGPLSAAVDIELARPPGAAPRRAVVAIDPSPLDRILATECARAVVSDAVSIGFVPDHEIDATILGVDVAVDRREGDEAVTVTALRGTEIFTLRQAPTPTDPVAVLAPGAGSLRVPVEIEVSRCDPHVVGQSTRTYDFKLWVAIGDREPQEVVLDPGEAMRSDLREMIARCVGAGGP